MFVALFLVVFNLPPTMQANNAVLYPTVTPEYNNMVLQSRTFDDGGVELQPALGYGVL